MDNPTSSLSRPSSDYDDTLDDLLLIRDLASNPAWLNDNQALVQRTIADGLRVPTLHLDTITTIADLLTAALAQGDRDDWFGSIAAAVAAWDVPPSSQFCIGFRAVIADFYRHIATYADRDIAPAAHLEALLHVYIRLFRVLELNHALIIPHGLLDQAEHVSDTLGDPLLTARLEQTLALYYVHAGDFMLAERYALRAYNAYEYRGDRAGSADAACTLAIVYRNAWKFKRGDDFLIRTKQALDRAKDSEYSMHYATLLYEEAVRCYRTDSFMLGQRYIEDALEIFERHAAADYQIAMTHQLQAMIHIHTGKFDEATAEIAFVRPIWQALGNAYELANLHFIEADREFQRGDRPEGHRLLDVARAAARALPETPARDTLISLIDDHARRYP